MFIVAKQAEQVISGFEQVARFKIVVDRKSNRDEMVLKIEVKDGPGDKGRLLEEINKKFQDLCRLKLDNIEIVPPGSLLEPQKTLEDIRKWE
jgi:phenylacetate-coenzyme A ligase PaaK-like adenylate-forming protein